MRDGSGRRLYNGAGGCEFEVDGCGESGGVERGESENRWARGSTANGSVAAGCG